MSRKPVNLTSLRFGRLVALYPHGRSSGAITWLCRCDCGEYKIVKSYNLTKGGVKSCGCLRKGLKNEICSEI